MSFKDISYLELWQPLCSLALNHMCKFGRRNHEERFCEIILILDQWFRRCCWKIFLIWRSGGPFVQWSKTICAILVDGIMRKKSVKICWIWISGSGGDGFKAISYLELWLPFCSAQLNNLCNFGRWYQEKQFCEIILNLDQWDVISGALAALVFGGAEPFMQF